MTEIQMGNFIFKLTQGDITLLDVDMVVNAANTSLILGSGVAGAIRKKGGPSIQKECNDYVKKNGKIKTGDAVITTGGDMKAKYVVHAAGPIYGNYNPNEASRLLKNSVINSLAFLTEKDKKYGESIAFPAISAGVYGFPEEECADIMISTIFDYIKSKNFNNGEMKNQDAMQKTIIICLYGNEMYSLFQRKFEDIVKN